MASKNQFIIVRKSKIQGRGVFASGGIPTGTRIIEYLGERISQEEAFDRYDDDDMDRHHTFLFGVDRHTVIDAAVNGNAARFINHSCAPNCEAVLEDKRIFIEAIRDIKTGEELVYDYRLERPGRFQEKWRIQYACHCGAPHCRGMLIAPRKKRSPAKKTAPHKKNTSVTKIYKKSKVV